MAPKIKAFIFDMDGTITDNMFFHLEVWERIVNEMGGSMKGDLLKKELYGSNELIIKRIFGNHKFSEASIYEWGEYKETLYRQLYKGKIKPLAGLIDFMNTAKKNNIKLALGTAGTTENIAFNLAEIGITDYFDAIVGKADISHTKPHPETFLTCASKLKILPEECLVFEDVPKGIETAHNAGMNAVAVTTNHHKNEFINFNNIVTFISDFNTITPDELI